VQSQMARDKRGERPRGHGGTEIRAANADVHDVGKARAARGLDLAVADRFRESFHLGSFGEDFRHDIVALGEHWPARKIAQGHVQGRTVLGGVHRLAREERCPPCLDTGRAREIERADILLILNRNENIIPAVARLSRAQAAAYFMLGETQGTSAGGADEMGKFLRVPGTNPFFPLLHDHQGNRFHELLEHHKFGVFLLNTGRVGGGDYDDRSKKVGIDDSSAIVKAIAEGTIEWETDPDFGYQVATALPGIGDEELLQPRRLYARQDRGDEYAKLVDADPRGPRFTEKQAQSIIELQLQRLTGMEQQKILDDLRH